VSAPIILRQVQQLPRVNGCVKHLIEVKPFRMHRPTDSQKKVFRSQRIATTQGYSARSHTNSRSEAAPARATLEYIPVVRYSVGLAP
jgi:hypothetical protein